MKNLAIGVEGGGTKTRVVIVDPASGATLGSSEGGGTNFYLHPDAKACAGVIATVVADALLDINRHDAGSGSCQHLEVGSIGLCVSGAGTEPARTQLREAVAALYPRATVVAASDAYAAIATAGHASGVVVIAGTGSVAMRFDATSGADPVARCGGWGHLVGDEGSAFSIAMCAMKAVLHDADGFRRAEHSTAVVWDAMKARFDGVSSPVDLLPLLYAAPRLDKACVAQLTLDIAAAAPTDPLCASLFRDAGASLGRMLAAVLPKAASLEEEIPVVLVGGVFQSWPLLRVSFLAALDAGRSAAHGGSALALAILAATADNARGAAVAGARAAGSAMAPDSSSSATPLLAVERVASLRARTRGVPATTPTQKLLPTPSSSLELSLSTLPPDRGHITTEQRNPLTSALHTLTPRECIATLIEVDAAVAPAVRAASSSIGDFLADAAAGFCRGGRLVYVGAGTSGRLGVLDASEAPPTFNAKPGRVVGVIAGGMRALTISAEAKEDEKTGAVEALSALLPPIGANDTVLGITSGGTTPYPRGAVTWASSQGAVTGLLTCSPVDAPPGCAHLIIVSTGPEALTGSTRMKAGTATKVKSIFPAFHDE